MSRMIDKIRAGLWEFPEFAPESDDPVAAHKVRTSTHERLQGAVVVIVDNVAEYLYAGTDQEDFSLAKDFPCVMPPAPQVFVETSKPSKIVSVKHGVLLPTGDQFMPDKWGYLVTLSRWNTVPEAFKEKLLPTIKGATPVWAMQMTLFMENHKFVLGQISEHLFILDAAGAVIGTPLTVIPFREQTEAIKRMSEEIHILTYAPLLAFSLMSCKNITRTKVDPPVKLSKSFQKKHGVPMTSYHILNIHPMQVHKLGASTSGGDSSGSRSLSFCRNHFKTYTPEKPLFGKHTGTYFWGFHARGNPQVGTVEKSYNVYPK